MKLRSLILSVIAAGMFASQANAAGTIAIVNFQQIMHDSTAAKSLNEQMEAKKKAFQAQMSKKEEELQKEDQDLVKERAVLSPDAFDKKLKDFRARAAAAEKDVQGKRAELENALSPALGEIQKAVYGIVSSIAKTKGYTVVLPSSQVLYSDPALDITQDVLSQLNSTLPKVTVTFKSVSQKDDE